MNQEEVQSAIDLTPDQEKAWARLKRAVKDCRKTGIMFYQVLDSLGPLNGKNVATVHDEGSSDDPTCLQWLHVDFIETTGAWADDNHFVKLKDQP